MVLAAAFGRMQMVLAAAFGRMQMVLAAAFGRMQIRGSMRRPVVVSLVLVALLGTTTGEVRAQSGENGGLIGLVLPLGARTIGQGRAVVAERAELQALPYNPAAVHGLERGAVTYSRFEGADLGDDLSGFNGNYVAAAYAGDWGTLAGHLVYQDLGEVLLTDTSPDPIGSVDLAEWVLGVTYAGEFREKLAYGLTAKWYASDLGVADASGPAFDAGVVYHPRLNVPLSLAVSLRNLGPDIEFEDTGEVPGGSGGEEALPSRVRVGIAIDPDRFMGLPANYGVRFLFDIESDLRELSTSSQHFGAVLSLQELIDLRGGVLIADNPFVDEGDGNHQVGGAFGIGLRLAGFEADISREFSVSELGDETHFGVGWRF